MEVPKLGIQAIPDSATSPDAQIKRLLPACRPNARTPHHSAWASILNQDNQYAVAKEAQLREFFHANLIKLGLTCLIKANTAEQVRKTRVVAHRIRKGLYFDPLQNIGLLLVRSFEPGKRLVVVAEAHIILKERSGRNVALLPASLQFFNQTKRLRTSAGMPVSSGQDADYAGTSMSDGNGPLKWPDGILGFSFPNKRESQQPKGISVVRSHCQDGVQ